MEISDRAWMHLKKSIEETTTGKVCVILTKGEIAVFELPQGYTIKKVKESEIEGGQQPEIES